MGKVYIFSIENKKFDIYKDWINQVKTDKLYELSCLN